MNNRFSSECEPRPFNVIGLLGFMSGVFAYVLLFVTPILTVFFWMIGHIFSFIGLFRPRRVWAVFGYILSMIPLLVIPFILMNVLQMNRLSSQDGFMNDSELVVDASDVYVEEESSENKEFIEIRSPRGGYANVYIGMPKEEVKSVLGRPKKVKAHNGYGNVLYETWEYDLPNYSWMTIEIKDGKLTSFNQY